MAVNFRKKEGLEEILLGDGEGTVFFDSDTGNTHVLDEVASDIFSCFNTESNVDKVIEMLAEMYGEEPVDIETDVREFVSKLVSQGLLVPREE